MKKFNSLFILLLSLMAALPAYGQEPGSSPEENKLLAHLTFDSNGFEGTVDNLANPSKPATLSVKQDWQPGVFGQAITVQGTFNLSLPADIMPETMEQFAISLWIRPDRVDVSRQLFRKEEGDQRLLFGLLSNGRYMIGGFGLGEGRSDAFLTIDNPFDLDEGWHFVVLQYNGTNIECYIDDRKPWSLPAPGKPTFGKTAPLVIGSSMGVGEFFEGGIDDFRLSERAYTDAEVKQMYQQGLDSLTASLAELQAQNAELINSVYAKLDNFMESLRVSRENIIATGEREKYRGAALCIAKDLAEKYPEQHVRFRRLTGLRANHFLTMDSSELNELIRQILPLYTEFLPITEEQWADQSPEDTARWREVEQTANVVKVRLANDPAEKDHTEEFFSISRSLEQRPVDGESLAPWSCQETPVATDLTAEEGKALIEKDWMFQAEGQPTPERIRNEIKWTGELMDRLEESSSDFEKERATLAELQTRADAITENNQALYFEVRGLKREIMFRNPALDFNSLLYIDVPYPTGNEWNHETRHRTGYMSNAGGRLMTLDGLSPSGHQQVLMPKAPLVGAFWRPDLSWDATKVLFCFKPHNERAFHLYEINLDGTGLRQLTGGNFDDLDPIYLPDGKNIIFTTSRGHTYVRCQPPTLSPVMARMALGGNDIYLLSRNNEPDYLPTVLPDGRIIYSRWEYTDKPLWRCVSVWTMNPDGTQTQVLWGNQSVWPDLPKEVRAIPDSTRLMFIGSGHHYWFGGPVGILNPSAGLNFPDGLSKVTADVPWGEVGNGPVDPIESENYHVSGKYEAYETPYPLNETDFLVSAKRAGEQNFALFLMDTEGNRELILEGKYNILYPTPIRPRTIPPVLTDRVSWPTREERNHPADGIIYSNNVYDGAPPELAGKAKYLRIMNVEPKTYTYWVRRNFASSGPAPSMLQADGVKRIIGTVPIEEDGSVSFYAPSGVALHFQLLDEKMRCLQTMRSFTGVMPGEQRGCTGCHESHITTPAPEARSMAVTRGPSTITPPSWNDISVSYERYVQPTLDKHCGKCHEGDGEAKQVLDLTLRPGLEYFKEPYSLLIGRPSVGGPYMPPKDPPPGYGIADTLLVEAFDTKDPEGYITPPPMTRMSYVSRLVNKYCQPEHYDVQLSEEELQRMIVWVDAMCPYLGSEEVRAMPDPVFPGSSWLPVKPRLETAPSIRRPGPFDAFGKDDEIYQAPTPEKVYANPATPK